MQTKRFVGLSVATFGVFMCIFFRFTMTRVKNELQIQDKKLDFDLVSIEDYTISGKIDKTFYRKVLRLTELTELYKNDQRSIEYLRRAPINRFQDYLVKTIQANLKSHDDALTDDQMEIADLTFSYDNGEMLSLLAKRNEYLKKSNPRCCLSCRQRRTIKDFYKDEIQNRKQKSIKEKIHQMYEKLNRGPPHKYEEDFKKELKEFVQEQEIYWFNEHGSNKVQA